MIDTLDTANTLEKQGFTKSQAEGLAHALKQAVTEAIPTKNDFADLRRDFGELGRQLTDLKRDFTDLKGSVNLLGWMTGINIPLTLLVLGKLLLTGRP